MRDDRTGTAALERSQTVELVASQKLVIERHEACNVLTIVGAGGSAALSIRITERGAELELGGSDLAVRTRGELSVDARKVSLHGREGVVVTSGGNMVVRAEGAMRSTARAHEISAELGDVEIRANDDVKLDGERIRMNC